MPVFNDPNRAGQWAQIDLSHRKLAHRGSRLDLVYVAESTVMRVPSAAGMHLPGIPRIPRDNAKKPRPDCLRLQEDVGPVKGIRNTISGDQVLNANKDHEVAP